MPKRLKTTYGFVDLTMNWEERGRKHIPHATKTETTTLPQSPVSLQEELHQMPTLRQPWIGLNPTPFHLFSRVNQYEVQPGMMIKAVV